MIEVASRVEWLERNIAQAREFLARDRAHLTDSPDDFAAKLSARSWETHMEEMQQELRQTKEAMRRELVEVRLFGAQVDNGSIPLRLLSRISHHINTIIGSAAHHIRHGVNPARGVSDELANELDLRLSGLAFGSSRLLISGNIAPDTTGESLLDISLERLFDVINSTTSNEIHDLVPVIGTKAFREIDELLGAFESQNIGASMRWSAPNEREHSWGGSLQAVRTTRARLAQISQREPEPEQLSGTVRSLSDTGRIAVQLVGEPKLVRIRFPKALYNDVQQLTLGATVTLNTIKHSFIDELTGEEVVRYVLIRIPTDGLSPAE